MKKLNNNEAELKESIAYKKACTRQTLIKTNSFCEIW